MKTGLVETLKDAGDCLDRIDSLLDELIEKNRELEKAEKCRDKGLKLINGKEV